MGALVDNVTKGLCRLGAHSVKVWNYRQDDVCTQDGECQRCEATLDQVEHLFYWLEWDYDSQGPLTHVTDRCTRCNERASIGDVGDS